MAGFTLKLLFCLWAALMLGAPSPAMGARSLRQVATDSQAPAPLRPRSTEDRARPSGGSRPVKPATVAPKSPPTSPKPAAASPKSPAKTSKPPTAAPKSPAAAPKPAKTAPKSPAATPKPATAAPKSPAATPKPATAGPKSPAATPEPNTAAPKSPAAMPQLTPDTPSATFRPPPAAPKSPLQPPASPAATLPKTSGATGTCGAAHANLAAACPHDGQTYNVCLGGNARSGCRIVSKGNFPSADCSVTCTFSSAAT
ncbi:hypothetical protein CVIRNUC_000288 [Coccomyxa viridis]|uniref:Uncharacterized protein n=1 Tax=Coccomyxa viridis TaxID=1274662 RepID=A0AAV1HTS1_9CHLO|nr:hypothetical protein CVIRNUC_000288 [Coccomyxa viridis]